MERKCLMNTLKEKTGKTSRNNICQSSNVSSAYSVSAKNRLKLWPTHITCLPPKQQCPVNSINTFREDVNQKSVVKPAWWSFCYTEAMGHRELFITEPALHHDLWWNLKVRRGALLQRRGLPRRGTKISLSGKLYLLTIMARSVFAVPTQKGLGLVLKEKRC